MSSANRIGRARSSGAGTGANGHSQDRPSVRRQRCAIYTRVSTEHGLDMEFNSLDAQREACEAYYKQRLQSVPLNRRFGR